MYLTDEKQILMVKNLNYLMRKRNITNPVLQEGMYGVSDRNGKIVAKIRGGKRRINEDDVISICVFFHITMNVFIHIDLENLEGMGIDVDEASLMRQSEYEKTKVYRYRDIKRYNKVCGITTYVFIGLLIAMSVLAFFFNNYERQVYITLSSIMVFFILGLGVRGGLNYVHTSHIFLLPESAEYYYIQQNKKKIGLNSSLLGVSLFLLVGLFAVLWWKNPSLGIVISLFLFILLVLNIVCIVLYAIPRTKYMVRVPMDMFYIDELRRYAMILLPIGLGYSFYTHNVSCELRIVYLLTSLTLIILSEIANKNVLSYYHGYTGKEEK